MDILHLKSFMNVMKTRSFSKAGKVSFRSQPMISRHIKSLESELGVRLFERFGPMSVKPTQEALILKEIVQPVVNQFESIKSMLDEKRGLFKVSEIKIATHESAKMPFLLHVFAKFHKKNPGVKISLARNDRKEVVSMVLEGKTDFGITSLDEVPPGIHYRVFASHNRVLMMPRNHPLTKKDKISLEDIAKYPLILPPADSRMRRTIDKVFKKAGLAPNVALEIMGRDSAKAYVSNGFGLSIINEYYITPSDFKKMRCVDVSEYFGQTKRGIIQRKDRELSPLHNELIERIVFKTKRMSGGS